MPGTDNDGRRIDRASQMSETPIGPASKVPELPPAAMAGKCPRQEVADPLIPLLPGVIGLIRIKVGMPDASVRVLNVNDSGKVHKAEEERHVTEGVSPGSRSQGHQLRLPRHYAHHQWMSRCGNHSLGTWLRNTMRWHLISP